MTEVSLIMIKRFTCRCITFSLGGRWSRNLF